MTLEQKIDRLLNEADEQHIKRRIAAPWFCRALWRAGLDVPPPILWPFWMSALTSGIYFALFLFLMNLIPFFHEPNQGIRHYFFEGIFFGLWMTFWMRRFSNRGKFSRWYGEPAGNV